MIIDQSVNEIEIFTLKTVNYEVDSMICSYKLYIIPYIHDTVLSHVYNCLQVLIGNERQDCPLPVIFTEEEYEQLTEAAKQLNLEVNLVHQCYQQDGSKYQLVKDK